ncbi:uncharacterized protein PG998_004761 [Apiospora kogelbergensis]|uniref:uncharacterized protein n=1 Tax=Apiospora kogelbergensis TaxID=1337665 RepID=UPI0031317187
MSSAFANHQRLTHVSQMAQLEAIVVVPNPQATTTGTITTRGRSSRSRRHRAATTIAAAGPQRPSKNPKQNEDAIPEGGDDSFWCQPTSPVKELQEPKYYRVATDIRISLKGPNPTLETDSEEFKKQAKEIKKDMQRLSRYSRRQYSNPATLAEYSRLQLASTMTTTNPTSTIAVSQQQLSQPLSPSSPPPNLQPQSLEELQHEHEFRRRFSIQEAHDFLSDFLQVHFAEHRDLVTVRTSKTLEEVKMIGNEEDVASGVRQCRRLFNAPVISDRVGSLLYEELRQGADLDHSHEWWRCVHDDDDQDYDYGNDEYDEMKQKGATKMMKRMTKMTADELRRRRDEDFERSKAKFIEMRQLATPFHNSDITTNTNPYGLCRCAPMGGQAPSMLECIKKREKKGEESASRDPLEGRKSVDGLLSEVKRRTWRGAEYIVASLAAGYQ